MPTDIVMPMSHDIPLVWRTSGGHERLASVPAVTPVVLRGVDPSDMAYGENDLGQPKAGYRGRVWFPYRVSAVPAGMAPDAFRADCAVAPPWMFSIRFAGAKAREGTAYPAPDKAVARAVEMPGDKAAAWVSRTVAEDLVHDGRVVWLADPLARTDGMHDAVRQDEDNFHRLVTVYALRLLRDVSEMLAMRRTTELEDAAARCRRLVVRTFVRDVGREQRHGACRILEDLSGQVLRAHHAYGPVTGRARQLATDARRMAEGGTGAIRIPDEDDVALGGLLP